MSLFEIIKKSIQIATQKFSSAQFLKAEYFPKKGHGNNEDDLDEFYPLIIGPSVLGTHSFNPLINSPACKTLANAIQEYKEMSNNQVFIDILLSWPQSPNSKACYTFRTKGSDFVVIDFK